MGHRLREGLAPVRGVFGDDRALHARRGRETGKVAPRPAPGRTARICRVSPLMHAHVRVLCRYHFRLDESVARGEMRTLRDPAEIDGFEPPIGL